MAKENEKIEKRLSLEEQLVLECMAMAKYAMASGKKVPVSVIRTIISFGDARMEQNLDFEISNLNEKGLNSRNIKEHRSIAGLTHSHHVLSRIIEPAKPSTVLLLQLESAKKNPFLFLGQVPLVRRLMGVAIFFLILFIYVCISPNVDSESISKGILDSSGLPMLLTIFLYISAAGLGGAFSSLFLANKYIVKGTFDPKYETSYWIRLILGIIAGLTLALLIPLNITTSTSGDVSFTKPLLSMLGGFSSSLVYNILNRLVETVSSLVKGSADSMIEAKEIELKAGLTEDHNERRFKLATEILDLQQKIDAGDSPEEVKTKLGKFLNDLVPMDFKETKEEEEEEQQSEPIKKGK